MSCSLFPACNLTRMQKVAFCVAICHLLDAKRLPFTVQKVTFHNEAYLLLPYFQMKPRPEFVDFAIFPNNGKSFNAVYFNLLQYQPVRFQGNDIHIINCIQTKANRLFQYTILVKWLCHILIQMTKNISGYIYNKQNQRSYLSYFLRIFYIPVFVFLLILHPFCKYLTY